MASSVREWPQWLRPAQVNIPDNSHLAGKVVNLNAVVKKKRPLIYVYDLPPDFNSLLLEVRIRFSWDYVTNSKRKCLIFSLYCCRDVTLSSSV